MPKVGWNELVEVCRAPHAVVAIVPDSSDEERLARGQHLLRLFVRLLKKLPIKDDYAVAIHRKQGRREIVCAFLDGADARHLATTAHAAEKADRGCWASRHSFMLDQKAEEMLLAIAGPPEVRRHPVRRSYDR